MIKQLLAIYLLTNLFHPSLQTGGDDDNCLCGQLDAWQPNLNYKLFDIDSPGRMEKVREHLKEQMQLVATKISTIVASKAETMMNAGNSNANFFVQRFVAAVKGFKIRQLPWSWDLHKSHFKMVPMNEGDNADLNKGQFNYSEGFLYELTIPMFTKAALRSQTVTVNSIKELKLNIFVKIKQSRIPNFSGYRISWVLDQPFVYAHNKLFLKKMMERDFSYKVSHYDAKPTYELTDLDDKILIAFLDNGGHNYKFTQAYGNYVPVHLCRNIFIFYNKVIKLLTMSMVSSYVSTREQGCQNMNGAVLRVKKKPKSLQTLNFRLKQKPKLKVMSEETKVRMSRPIIQNFNNQRFAVRKTVVVETPPDDKFFTHMEIFLYQISIYILNMPIYNKVSIFLNASNDKNNYANLLAQIPQSKKVHEFMAYLMRVFMRYYYPETAINTSIFILTEQELNSLMSQSKWWVMLIELVQHFMTIESEEGYYDTINIERKFGAFLMRIDEGTSFYEAVMNLGQAGWDRAFKQNGGVTKIEQKAWLSKNPPEKFAQDNNYHLLMFVKVITYTVLNDLFLPYLSHHKDIKIFFMGAARKQLAKLPPNYIFTLKFLQNQVDVKVDISKGTIQRIKPATKLPDRKAITDGSVRTGIALKKETVDLDVEKNTIQIPITEPIAKTKNETLMVQGSVFNYEIISNTNGKSQQIVREPEQILDVIDKERFNETVLQIDEEQRSPAKKSQIKNKPTAVQVLGLEEDLYTVNRTFTMESTLDDGKFKKRDEVLIERQIIEDPEIKLREPTKFNVQTVTQVEVQKDSKPKKSQKIENEMTITNQYMSNTRGKGGLLKTNLTGQTVEELDEVKKARELVVENSRNSKIKVMEVNEIPRVKQEIKVQKIETDLRDLQYIQEIQEAKMKMELLKQSGLHILQKDKELQTYLQGSTSTFKDVMANAKIEQFRVILQFIFSQQINRTQESSVPYTLLGFNHSCIKTISETTEDIALDEDQNIEFIVNLILRSTFLRGSLSEGYFNNPSKLLLDYDSRPAMKKDPYDLPQPDMIDSSQMVGNDKVNTNLMNNILLIRHHLIVSVHESLMDLKSEKDMDFEFTLQVDLDYRARLIIIREEEMMVKLIVAKAMMNLTLAQLGEYGLELMVMSNEGQYTQELEMDEIIDANYRKSQDFRELTYLTDYTVKHETVIDDQHGEFLVQSSLNNPALVKESEHITIGQTLVTGPHVTKEELNFEVLENLEDKKSKRKVVKLGNTKESKRRKARESRQVKEMNEEAFVQKTSSSRQRQSQTQENVYEVEFQVFLSDMKNQIDVNALDMKAMEDELIKQTQYELDDFRENGMKFSFGNVDVDNRAMTYESRQVILGESKNVMSYTKIAQDYRLLI